MAWCAISATLLGPTDLNESSYVYMKAVRIGNLAGHIKRHDCASAVWHYLVSAKKAFREKAALGGSIALADDIFISPKIPQPDRQFQDTVTLIFRKGGDAFQLSNELIERLMWHFSLHRLGREHKRLSVTSARKNRS
jgi:hypothetical protein